MADTPGRRNMEKVRFQKVLEKYSPKYPADKYTLNDQKVLTARLDELKKEPFRIRSEMAGLTRPSVRGTQPPEIVPLGDISWKGSDTDSIPLSALLEDVRRKGNKERNEFIVRRMGTLTGNAQEHLIHYVRTNITGLMAVQEMKPKDFFNTPMDREPYLTLFDFPGRHTTRSFVPIKNYFENRETPSAKDKIKKNPSDHSLFGFPSRKAYERFYDMWKKNEDNSKSPSLCFCTVGDCHRAVRHYMRTIGWHEKFCTPEERTILSRGLQRPGNDRDVTNLFREHPVKFIWVNGYLNWTPIHHGVIVSRIPSSNAYFSKVIFIDALQVLDGFVNDESHKVEHTNKQSLRNFFVMRKHSLLKVLVKMSLSMSLKDLLPFIYEKGEVDAKIPRTFEVRCENDMKHFSKQFRINACVCMLKKYIEMHDDKGLLDVDGSVPLETVDFAVKRVVELLRYTEHADLEHWHFSVVSDEDWDVFLFRFHDIVHFDAKFQMRNTGINTSKLLSACVKLLESVYKYFPEMKYEGTKNLWICKPSNGSCGRGVKVFRKLEDIKNNCKSTNFYVIQKYIERPFLIYNTKFDIRQWFVITSVSPLHIWMYNECYLRFCSQEFTLKNLHESVHLCNNTIQWKYKNGVRSSKLPNDNMWDNHTFDEFLRKELKMDQWFNIQEQMRQAIIAACIATQDKMFNRANSFHLYGADFMLTPDFQVWLIEINCQPSMKYSTTVTARMCKEVLEDTIKVGLERALNPLAPVGKFREIYRKQTQPPQLVLPFAGKMQARKKKKLPRKPYPYINSGHTSNKSNCRKWISYEDIANYKRHSMLSVKLDVKMEQPLDPGDATAVGTTNSSVVINENPASNENDKEDTNIKKKVQNVAPVQNKLGDNKTVDDKNDNTTDHIHKVDNKKDEHNNSQISNQKKEKLKDSNKRPNESHNVEKMTIVMIPEENTQPKRKHEETGRGIDQTQGKRNAPNDRMITKEELLEDNPGELFKEVSELKRALLRKKYINTKPLPQKARLGRQQSFKLSQNDQGDNRSLDKTNFTSENSIDKSNNEQIEDKSKINIVQSKNFFYYKEEKSENNIEAILNKTVDENPAIKNLYLQALQENAVDIQDKSQNSSHTDLLFDIFQDEGNELWPEFSGYTIIGESAIDRELESVLNSPKYLNAIGKNETNIAPIYKGIVCRRRECCE